MVFFPLIKAAKQRRLLTIVGVLIALFVLSLFMVDLDSEDGEGEDVEILTSPTKVTSDSTPSKSSAHTTSFAQFSNENKLVTGYKYKIFVYEQDIPNKLYGAFKRDPHCTSEYNGMEAILPDLLKKLDIYTPYGDIADYYVVPVMTECFISKKLIAGKDYNRAVNELNSLFETTLDQIQSLYPHWSRTEGRDHIFLFPSERGPSLLSEANAQRVKKSIFLTGLASYKPFVFEPWKDVVIPAWRHTDEDNLFQPRPNLDSERDIFVYFRGSIPGLEDQQPSGLTHELQKALDNSTMNGKVLFSDLDEDCSNLECVIQEMRKSTFCLCPGGDYEGWSLRMYHAISAGCIPVILADRAELPFPQLLDYAKFSIKILERDASTVPKILNEMEEQKIKDKQKALQEVVDRFSWRFFTAEPDGKTSWKPGTALDSLLQILNLKLRHMRNSPYHFWLKEEL